MQTRQNTLFSVNDLTLQGDQVYANTKWVKAGHRVEFSVSATNTVNTRIVGGNGVIESQDERQNARYGFTAPIDDNYTFGIHNPHNGFFGLMAENVGIYSASAVESYDELVTKQRQTTEPVTETRTISKTVTLLEMLSTQR
jgi:hypothetical protein